VTNDDDDNNNNNNKFIIASNILHAIYCIYRKTATLETWA